MEKKILLLCLLLCGSAVFTEQPDNTYSKKIPFNGLTGTITDLLGSKPNARIPVGSCYINPDEIVEKSIDTIYDCDEMVNKYLTGNDECYYGQLAEIIKEKINNNVLDKTACVYVIADASEESNVSTISIAVNYSKNAILPVYIDTISSELKVSFAIPCTIEYNVSFIIEVDSDKVNDDDKLRGTSIGVESYTINIKPYEGDWNCAATIVYNNTIYELSLQEYTINAYINWMLLDNNEYNGETPQITYEQLSTGDYKWDIGSISYLSFSGEINNTMIDTDGIIEVSMAIDDTIDIEDQRIEITDEEGTKELAIKRLEY